MTDTETKLAGCIAIGGNCGEPCIAGWAYCRKHLQADQVAAALVASQARIAELKAALSEALGDGHNLKAFAGTMLRWKEQNIDWSDEAARVVKHAEKWHRIIADVLAKPDDLEALREFGRKVAKRVTQYDRQGESNDAAVDAVLKGER